MNNINEFIEEYLTEELIQIRISNARNKEGFQKVTVKPVSLKGNLMFQASLYKENKVFHNNFEVSEMVSQILEWAENDFKQVELESTSKKGQILISKKGKMTAREKLVKSNKKPDLAHNRKKNYILEEGIPVGFLMDLGVQSENGKIIKSQYDKFKQINRFLEFVEDILPALPKEREITILDFGCGKSYLTFAVYHYLHELKGYDIKVIGLDLKKDVINTCNTLRDKYQYDKLDFLVGDIADYKGVDKVDMVITLHACDTATDYALAKAVLWGAKVILSVPCCQHELNQQMKNEILEPILKYGLLKERIASLVTDGIRAELLSKAGYAVQILEFIDMEHTPKNILIRAIRSEEQKGDWKDYNKIKEFFRIEPTLEHLLNDNSKGGE